MGMAEGTECYWFGDPIHYYFPCACIGWEKLKVQESYFYQSVCESLILWKSLL